MVKKTTIHPRILKVTSTLTDVSNYQLSYLTVSRLVTSLAFLMVSFPRLDFVAADRLNK